MMTIASLGSYFAMTQNSDAQTYKAPQDTVTIKRSPGESLTTYTKITQSLKEDTRLTGAAVKAAEILADTTKYDKQKGILITTLLSKPDLEYVAKQGINGTVALFELINKYLTKGQSITFRTEQNQEVTIGKNPLVLKDLRAMISVKPATIQSNQPQWKENVYQAYMARDYGTKLHNTITITSATREIRESTNLEILDYNGSSITLAEILQREQAKNKNKYAAEKAAVAEFRARTFPGDKISKENANENYKRALFELIRLQEGDINRHPETKKFVEALTTDLKKGKESNTINALKSSQFFNANVPGNVGPVLLTEDQVISAEQVSNQAEAKALEITMLTALHYGERDAVKLLRQLINGKGSISATQTGDFTPKRLSELTDHGTEKMKSLGYGSDKTKYMTSSDLVLVAVAGPETPVQPSSTAYISVQQVGMSIMNQYSTIEIQETKKLILFNPRIKMASRHSEYRTAFDAVDFVPEYVNGEPQQGSRISQNGIEFRLESDVYLSNLLKIAEKGVKPVIYPEFGIIGGTGRRQVGYDDKTMLGEHGAVPKFNQNYINWGGHFGINVGPVMLGVDATVLSTPGLDDPYKRFFDLSHVMTYYRYTLLTHILNLGYGNIEDGKGTNFIVDLELTGETNNEGTTNHTHTQSGASQTGSAEWKRDYNRSHPDGVYNAEIATQMILDGDVKASYASSNYAALHLGIQKSAFLIKGTLGMYGIRTIEHYKEGFVKWNEEVFKSTIFHGNFFAGLSLTYNFGSRSIIEKRRKVESYQSTGSGDQSPHQVQESSSRVNSSFGPRDHVIFTNKKSRITPQAIEAKL
ncbi:hypothetical protein ADIARSV_4258 [Arcticibacter svalbardensis MN12-7]|uniref:Uncharacterized protein n=2 Tax=Arcticibacter TaxID=1288026 RepID=R9GLJ5_9SPHI|nr:hypothetical protein ADIARSV_4258 [Arcticibacter svalbardensis MN12-7]